MTLTADQLIRVNGQLVPAGGCIDIYRAALETAALGAVAATQHAEELRDLLCALEDMQGAPEDQTLTEFWDANPPDIY